MMTEQEKEKIWIEINRTTLLGTDAQALELVNQNPFVGAYRFENFGRLLTSMAAAGFVETCKRLLELGGELQKIEDNDAPISGAVGFGHYDVACLLLEHGSNPNEGRLLITASFSSERMNFDQRVAMVQLLIRYGARINDLYPMFGDKSKLRTVLDFVPESFPMFEYLRSLGAKTAKEVLAENPVAFINEF
jgi:ankyrin repeat protein